MKKLFTFSLFLLTLSLQAQKPYFQQKLDYDIAVTLNDVKHTLSGVENLTYQNNSGDTLRTLYFHLYYNAFNGSSTAYTRQLNRVNDATFSFAKPDQLGGYNKFSVRNGSQLLEVSLEKDNADIAKIILSQPLLPNQNVTLNISFEEKIPFAFSRPGHIEQQYLMTQWYPKPAVYDATGWHAQPYLENGEYYGEFATFDVKITLPENYIVAATGEMQTVETLHATSLVNLKTFDATSLVNLKTLHATSLPEDSFPSSSAKTKTIQYTASNVHDFGWFADKRFIVVSEKIEKCAYTEGDVICDVYFTPRDYALWKNGAHYARNAVEYYGTRIGKYPYSHASVVAQYDRRGGGMEYPMVTVIGGANSATDLESVVVHEVGHNWFYGILGNNERDNGWMDEGINTYYEMSYEDESSVSGQVSGVSKPSTLNAQLTNSSHPITYYADRIRGAHSMYFNHQAMAPKLSSDDFNNQQYGLAYYTRPALGLKTLEGYVGIEKFDAAMQSYFTKWKFKHPKPSDFNKILKETLGDSANWFLDGVIGLEYTTAYKIKSIKNVGANYSVVVQNKFGLPIPFSLSLVKNDSIIATKWYSGVECPQQARLFYGDKIKDRVCIDSTVSFPNYKTGGALILDAYNLLPQTNFAHTAINLKENGDATQHSPFKLAFITDKKLEAYKTKILYTPIPAYNVYDGFMAGAYISNITHIEKNWEWSAIPLYSFNTNALRGVAQVDYTFFNEKSRFIIGGDVRSFATSNTKTISPTAQLNANYFTRYDLNFRWDINNNSSSNTQKSIQFRELLVNQKKNYFSYLNCDICVPTAYSENNSALISELSYSSVTHNARSNAHWLLGAEVISNFGTFFNPVPVFGLGGSFDNYTTHPTLRLNAEYKYDYNYNPQAKFYIRAYVGTAIGAKNRFSGQERFVSLFQRGVNDYKFDTYFLGRNEFSGKWSQEIDENAQGGMKIILPNGYLNSLGSSGQFIASLNTKIDVPFKLPAEIKIQPYLDFGYFATDNNYSNLEPSNLLVSGGISVSIPKYFSVYVPLYYSGGACKDDPNGLSCIMEYSSFANKVSFSININSLLPKNHD